MWEATLGGRRFSLARLLDAWSCPWLFSRRYCRWQAGGAKKGKGDTVEFAVTKPESGAFIVNEKLTLYGTGANPERNHAMRVQSLHISSGASRVAEGALVVNSDGTWRYDSVELLEAGPYDVIVDAIFDEKRFSTTIRLNFEADSARDTRLAPSFEQGDKRFRVLILPFEALEKSRLRETKYARAIEKRLVEIQEMEVLELAVAYAESEDPPVGFRQASKVGRKHNADLVIWGDYYEKVHADTTHAALRYSFVNELPPNVLATGKTEIEEIHSLTLISQGYLQNDVDYIIYWVIALKRFAAGDCVGALPMFRRVRDDFAEHFQGIVSFELNASGMALSMNLPALQLFYHLGYCYTANGELEEAVRYWTALLGGGVKTAGGSMMAWDTLAISLSEGDSASVRVCTFALLNRAVCYRRLGRVAEANADYERLLSVADSSETVSEILRPVRSVVDEYFTLSEESQGDTL